MVPPFVKWLVVLFEFSSFILCLCSVSQVLRADPGTVVWTNEEGKLENSDGVVNVDEDIIYIVLHDEFNAVKVFLSLSLSLYYLTIFLHLLLLLF